MISGRRHRRIFAVLGIVALLAQLLLPTVHAQSWARQSGDPLLYAYCGQSSQILLERLIRTAPPDVLKALKLDQYKLAQMKCPLCSLLHIGHAAGTSSAVLAFAPLPATAQPDADYSTARYPHPLLLPPSRAPPLLS